MNVFISGSISIDKLPAPALEKINSVISKNYRILIGDAKGVDSLVQEYLLKKKYDNVIVYFTGENVRNNAGDWESNKIIADSDKKKGRELHTVKDKAMAKDADYGLMVWDGKSKGTLGNIKEMKKLNKRFYVILNGKIIDDKNFNADMSQKTKKAELQPVLL
jgi:tRNA(Ile)-lysidine synthase TilS/MesJ